MSGRLYRPIPVFYRRAHVAMTLAFIGWFVALSLVVAIQGGVPRGDLFVAALGLIDGAVMTAWLRRKAAGDLP